MLSYVLLALQLNLKNAETASCQHEYPSSSLQEKTISASILQMGLQKENIDGASMLAASLGSDDHTMRVNSTSVFQMGLQKENIDAASTLQVSWFSSDHTIRVNSNKALCMNVAGGRLNSGDAIHLYTCTAAPNEQWEFRTSDSTIRLKSKPELCMNAKSGKLRSGDRIQLFTCKAARNEQWEIRSDSTIRLKSKPELCMNAGGGVALRAKIQLYTCTASSNEQFTTDAVNAGIRNGILDSKVSIIGTCAGVQAGAYRCGSTGKYIKWNIAYGRSDFTVVSHFHADRVAGTALTFVFWSGRTMQHVGLDGGRKFFTEGGTFGRVRHLGGTTLDTSRYQTIQLTRRGGILSVSLDGQPVAGMQSLPLSASIDAVGWRPWRNNLKVTDLYDASSMEENEVVTESKANEASAEIKSMEVADLNKREGVLYDLTSKIGDMCTVTPTDAMLAPDTARKKNEICSYIPKLVVGNYEGGEVTGNADKNAPSLVTGGARSAVNMEDMEDVGCKDLPLAKNEVFFIFGILLPTIEWLGFDGGKLCFALLLKKESRWIPDSGTGLLLFAPKIFTSNPIVGNLNYPVPGAGKAIQTVVGMIDYVAVGVSFRGNPAMEVTFSNEFWRCTGECKTVKANLYGAIKVDATKALSKKIRLGDLSVAIEAKCLIDFDPARDGFMSQAGKAGMSLIQKIDQGGGLLDLINPETAVDFLMAILQNDIALGVDGKITIGIPLGDWTNGLLRDLDIVVGAASLMFRKTQHCKTAKRLQSTGQARKTFSEMAGTDVKHVYVRAASEAENDRLCWSECNSNARCEFWVRETGLNKRSCWLKRDPGSQSTRANRRGGYAAPWTATFQEMAGTDVEKVYVETSTEKDNDHACSSQCSANPQCEFWVRDVGSNRRECWLKRNAGRQSDNSIRRGGYVIRDSINWVSVEDCIPETGLWGTLTVGGQANGGIMSDIQSNIIDKMNTGPLKAVVGLLGKGIEMVVNALQSLGLSFQIYFTANCRFESFEGACDGFAFGFMFKASIFEAYFEKTTDGKLAVCFALKKIFDSCGGGLENILMLMKAVGEMVVKVVGAIADAVGKAFEAVGKWVADVGEAFLRAGKIFVNAIGKAFEKGLATVEKWAGEMGEAVVDLAADVEEVVDKMLRELGEWAEGVMVDGVYMLKGFAKDAGLWIENAVEDASDAWSNAMRPATQPAAKAMVNAIGVQNTLDIARAASTGNVNDVSNAVATAVVKEVGVDNALNVMSSVGNVFSGFR